MKSFFLSFLLYSVALLPAAAEDGLPVLQRTTLPNEQMWQLETELVGQKERNGAVLECMAEALNSMLLQADMEPTVASLVLVLTTPSDGSTPQAAIKELLLPRTQCIQVSPDATFAVIETPVHGGTILEIFRDTAHGLIVRRVRH